MFSPPQSPFFANEDSAFDPFELAFEPTVPTQTLNEMMWAPANDSHCSASHSPDSPPSKIVDSLADRPDPFYATRLAIIHLVDSREPYMESDNQFQFQHDQLRLPIPGLLCAPPNGTHCSAANSDKISDSVPDSTDSCFAERLATVDLMVTAGQPQNMTRGTYTC